MIHLEQLSKTFYASKKQPGLVASIKSLFVREKIAKHALREVSFSVGAGEIVGLIGANGAGKTTLIKILAGIIQPSSGSAKVLGFDPYRKDNHYRRQMALIMGQKAQLWWDLPAADCFLLLREIYQVPKPQFEKQLNELTERLDVKEQLHVQIRRLSLGERMKMEIIAALLHSPKVLYLDEPTIGLDLSTQKSIRDFILEYREREQPAIILTSHYMEDIERLCKRIIIMREGSVIYDGDLEHILRQHATTKSITIHLQESNPQTEVPPQVSHLPCEIKDDCTLRFTVARENVGPSAKLLLEHFAVADLTIEETGVADIIESIQNKQQFTQADSGTEQ